jgi:hypothetical protein
MRLYMTYTGVHIRIIRNKMSFPVKSRDIIDVANSVCYIIRRYRPTVILDDLA